jgi:hypothetical protein
MRNNTWKEHIKGADFSKISMEKIHVETDVKPDTVRHTGDSHKCRQVNLLNDFGKIRRDIFEKIQDTTCMFICRIVLNFKNP